MLAAVGIVGSVGLALACTQTWGLDSTVSSMSIDDMMQNAKSGDLLFFRRNSIDLAHDLVSGYSHVAVIVEQVTCSSHIRHMWLAEMRAAEKNKSPGVHLCDLRAAVTEYESQDLVVLVRRTVPIDPAAFMHKVTSVQHASYPRHLRWYIAACKLVPWLFLLKDDSVMICSEFVLRVLGESRWRCQTPASVMEWATHNTAYAPPVKIVGLYYHAAAASGHLACD